MNMKMTLWLLGASLLSVALLSSMNNNQVASAKVLSAQADSTIDWKKMSHDEKKDYMKTVVLPRMRKEFRAFDSVRFEKIMCKTCHGDGVANESYKMPNARLPKLPNSAEGWQKLSSSKDSVIMKFMSNTVKPKMAELLGVTPFDPKTNPKGFGCHNCHTLKED
jgi:hypothetical protein